MHRLIGAGLLVLTLLPVHRVLRGRQVGVAGYDILGAAERSYGMLLLGGAIVLTIGVLASRIVSWESVANWLRRIARLITAPSAGVFASAAGVLCAVLTAIFAVAVLDGKPNLVDAMVQLLHSRFIAEGGLAGPTAVSTSFWHLQNSVATDAGWVSHFPPGYPVLLAAGHLAGAPWLVSALLAGAAVFFTALAAERLLPERRAAVRVGVLLAAQSPFLIGLAGAQMNHVGAAAFIALAIYAAVRGADSTVAGWALLSGAALGAAFTIRPYAAIAGAVPALAIALQARGGGWAQPATRVGYGLLGALPFGAAIAWYNARFFGSALRFGYEYSYGPSVGLGFRVDPWGNRFGPIEAVGYTASDLITLGQNLLETPVSAVAIVGAYLLISRRLAFGEKILLAWALLPVAANFFYWHHGIFMGPRMLNEVAPVWAVLTAVSAAGIVRSLSPDANFRGYFARTAAAVAAVATFAAGVLYLAPERLLAYGTFMPSSRIAHPTAPDSSLVFVHGAWPSRIVMRLAAAGMRLDSIETAMRHNQTCAVDVFSRLYSRRRGQAVPALPRLDFNVNIPRELPYETVRGEYTIRPGPGPMPPGCARELHADRLGTLDVTAMLWQVRVPGLRSGGAIVVRDMGPGENAEIIGAYPTLMPLMYYRPSPEESPVLAPYPEAVRRLWGD
ncbi:MAG TPA: hypothetical protein VMM17_09415 [Gemmatimonadaceae bacterium]|nr:hypothetical protein [Gemmatimonadaceae bacterium]